MTINRLYNEVDHENSDTALDPTASAADLLRIKQEQVEAGPGLSQDPRAVKRERMEAGLASTFSPPQSAPPVPPVQSQYQPASANPGLFLTPGIPTYGSPPPVNSLSNTPTFGLPLPVNAQFYQSNPPPPVNSQSNTPTFGLPLPVNSQYYQSNPPPPTNSQYYQSNPPPPTNSQYPPCGPQWRDILNNVRQQPNTERDPSYSNYGPAPGPASGPGMKAEPSPMFSPVRRRPRSLVSPPPPAQPLPSLGALFAPPPPQGKEGPDSPEELQVVQLAKAASSLNCSRQLCDWTDAHVETCQRLKLQKRCGRGDCSQAGLHALGLQSATRGALTHCPKLKEHCQYKFQGLKRMPLECFNSGRPDTTCREDRSVSMRLLYRRTSQSLKDPRVGRQDYASKSQHTAAKTLQTQGRGAEWDLDTIISTWSAINMVRVVPGDNPNLQHQDSDHESDIECLD